jgi:hypothetical protein
MITQAELQQLIDFEPGKHPVLSLFLNVDPSRRSKDKYMLWLRSLLKEVSGKADPADIERVEHYFGFEYDWQGRSIACFACTKAGLWQVFPLAVPMEDGVFVGDLPHIKLLKNLIDRHQTYGVALVDREGARLFQIHMGKIVETRRLGRPKASTLRRRSGQSQLAFSGELRHRLLPARPDPARRVGRYRRDRITISKPTTPCVAG